MIGGDLADTQEKLEEHTMQLQQFLQMRYVGPFRDEVESKLGQLSGTVETLEKWIKVQQSW